MTDVTQQPLVFLAEDESLLAMMLEDRLSVSGYQVILAPTFDSAMQQAGTAAMDVAILDINLGGKFSFPIAQVLRDRGIPFIFSSGYNDGVLPDEFRDEPIIHKPYDTRQLVLALSRLRGIHEA
jgi:DNA-binding response OmpR family regulator